MPATVTASPKEGRNALRYLKGIQRMARLRLRGPCGARAEFLLATTAQNLRRRAKLRPQMPLCGPIAAKGGIYLHRAPRRGADHSIVSASERPRRASERIIRGVFNDIGATRPREQLALTVHYVLAAEVKNSCINVSRAPGTATSMHWMFNSQAVFTNSLFSRSDRSINFLMTAALA